MRSEMGFVQLFELANQLILGSSVNSTTNSGNYSPKCEKVKSITKIYLQLKYLMKEDPIEISSSSGVLKYASFLKHLHDICLVKMIRGQSELLEEDTKRSDVKSTSNYSQTKRSEHIQRRITTLMLDRPESQAEYDKSRDNMIDKINAQRAARQSNLTPQPLQNAPMKTKYINNSGRRSHQARQSLMRMRDGTQKINTEKHEFNVQSYEIIEQADA